MESDDLPATAEPTNVEHAYSSMGISVVSTLYSTAAMAATTPMRMSFFMETRVTSYQPSAIGDVLTTGS